MRNSSYKFLHILAKFTQGSVYLPNNQREMYAALTVYRFPERRIHRALTAMAFFRFPLSRRKDIKCWKLMGTGRNGTFDLTPDLKQWAVMVFMEEDPREGDPSLTGDALNRKLYGERITSQWADWGCETWTILLEVIEGHGSWDGLALGSRTGQSKNIEGPVAILTRATIRWSKLISFWKHVAPVAKRFFDAPGVLFSVGIGEAPFFRQATFSLWSDIQDMKNFAYRSAEHRDVIGKTRSQRWYTEEMFLRFKPITSTGSIGGVDPLPLKARS